MKPESVIRTLKRTMATLAIALLSTLSSLAQTNRPLTVKLDTLEMNVCGPRSFTMPVWIGDIPVSDSLYGISIIISWDNTHIDLEDFVLTGSGTLSQGLAHPPQVFKDAQQGVLVIEIATDANGAPIAGAGKPLFFLRGGVRGLDTVNGLNGWIDVVNASFTSNVRYDPLIRRPGLVRVVRDTTAAYTGRMSVETESFDTARVDTVTLRVDNLAVKRVREITFSLAADTAYYYFADTVTTGTLAARNIWATREIVITPDTIHGRFVADSDLVEDGELLRVVLRRKTDSAFVRPIVLSRFSVNPLSCLGRLQQTGGTVRAEAIPSDTSTTGVEEERRLASQVSVSYLNGTITIRGDGLQAESVRLFDIMGTEVPHREPVRVGPSTLVVPTGDLLQTGIYFVALRNRSSLMYKQFTFIK